MSGSQLFHCPCGARRPVSNGLRVVGCVLCGRAMSPYKSDAFSIVPSRWIVSLATLTSQLLGIVAFLLAATWMLKLGHRNVGVVAVAVLSAVSVFAGGHAHRGSVGALGVCAGVDLASGVAALIRWPVVTTFLRTPLAWAAPRIAADLTFALSIVALLALLASVTCVCAVPQTRRFLAWQHAQLTLASRLW